ncbi:MAG: PAS domain S-box protein [Candidatus Kapabacteria bacterium]|nr:PAS domain S-box protein [Candidatus Kapabacteria bacterium]
MNSKDKSNEELIIELHQQKQKNDDLALYCQKISDDFKYIENSLRDSESKYKHLSDTLEAILDHIPGLVFYKDKLNNFIKVNKFVANAYQKAKQELENVNLANLHSKEEAESYFKDDLEVIESGIPKLNIVEKWDTPEGEKWISTSKIPFVDPDGNIDGIIGISLDITENEISEQALARSEDLYRDLIENSSDLICIHDLDGHILNVNRAAAIATGYSIDELLTMKIQDFLLPKLKKLFNGYIEKLIVNGTAKGIFTIITKSGERRLWEFNDSLRTEGVAKPIVRGMSIDITERKRDEAILRLYGEMIKNMSEGVQFSGFGDGLVYFTNPKFDQMFGYGSGEMIGRNISTIYNFDYESSSLNRSLIMKSIKDTGEWHGEISNVKKDGSSFWCFVNVSVFNHPSHGKVMMSIHQDISERKQKEEQISILTKAVEQSPASVVITNINGDIEYVNQKFCNLTGFTKDEALGLNPRILKSGKMNKEFYTELWKTILAGNEWHGELINKKKSGDLYWEEALIAPLKNIKGETTHYLGLKEDITKRKIAEEKLIVLVDELTQTKDTLEKINYEKDKFFSIIAHDLKGPFTGFLGLSRIIIEDFMDLSMKDVTELGKSMYDSADNLYRLLENLLEWSRMQRGVIDFSPDNYELYSIVKQNIEIVHEFAKQKQIELINNIPEGYRIYADIPMINTVFRNLISNAIKFTPRAGNIEIGITKKASDETIYIKDSGIGMSEDILSKLFQIDQKVSRPGTENEPSTGLGLLLVKEYVEKHGGKIWVESQEGKGTTFFFSIPEC